MYLRLQHRKSDLNRATTMDVWRRFLRRIRYSQSLLDRGATNCVKRTAPIDHILLCEHCRCEPHTEEKTRRLLSFVAIWTQYWSEKYTPHSKRRKRSVTGTWKGGRVVVKTKLKASK